MSNPYGMWTAPGGDPWVLNPPPGSVLVLRAGVDWTEEQARQAADSLSKYAAVLVLPASADLALLPEEAMRKLGWCRCDGSS